MKNYSFISGDEFYDDNADGVWCQSASGFNESADGGWYLPSGQRVEFSDKADLSLHQDLFTQQFVLLRDGTINSSGKQGLYQCIIPYSYDNISLQIIGIYGTGAYNENGMVCS